MSATTINNQGIIGHLPLPEGFAEAKKSQEEPNNYLEFESRTSGALICYEQSPEPFDDEKASMVESLLAEDLGESGVRELNIEGNPAKSHDDSEFFTVLSFCFIIGGYLTRGNTVMDMEKSKWQLLRINDEPESKNIVLGRMKFLTPMGRRHKREMLLVLPAAPGENGCGYLWLEGNSSEIRRFEKSFLDSISKSSFKKLTGTAAG